MIYLLILLVLLDALTTHFCMWLGWRERNYLLRWLMDKVGVALAVWGTHLAVVGAVLYWNPPRWVMVPLIAVYAWGVIQNGRALARL